MASAEHDRRWWGHLVNDNDRSKKPGGVGSAWRYGRFYLHSRARKRSDVLNVQWYFWKPAGYSSDIALTLKLDTSEGSSAQFHVSLWRLCSLYLNVAVSPRLIGWLVYEERLFGIRFFYVGDFARIYIADADSMSGLDYRPPCARCGLTSLWHEGRVPSWVEGTPCDAYEPRNELGDRVKAWKGWEVRVKLHVRDVLFGKTVYATVTEATESVEIEMDGEIYPATWELQAESWKRPRAFWTSARRRGSRLTIERGDDGVLRAPMFAGKGENSWDCDDDGIFGSGSSATTPAGAVADYIAAVARNRARYGPPSRGVT